jgi:hypothetical protein
MSSPIVAFTTQLTDIDITAKEPLGAIRSDQNHVYKYVQFGASTTGQVTAALAAGDVACYVNASGNATDDMLQLVDVVNTNLGAGVVQATVSATGGPYYGWLQIKGVATLDQVIGGSTAVGVPLTVSGATSKTLNAATSAPCQIVGWLVDSSTTSAPVVALAFPF